MDKQTTLAQEFVMELFVGFRPNEDQNFTDLRARFIVFPDGKCFMRNAGKDSWYAACLKDNPDYFIQGICYELSHEYLHPWLQYNVSEEACHKLNNVDGRRGHLLEPIKLCHACGKRILEHNGYIGQGVFFWHKKCHKP